MKMRVFACRFERGVTNAFLERIECISLDFNAAEKQVNRYLSDRDFRSLRNLVLRILREVFESIAYSNAISLTSQFVRRDVVPAGTIFILPGIRDWKSAPPFSLSLKTVSFV